MRWMVLWVAMCLGAASAQASPLAETLNSNTSRYQVNAATNSELQVLNNPFQSDSLAQSGSGMLFSVDASGMIFDVTGPFQIPVGPTSRTQIGDLVMGVNGVWGFSNASQELFFFDIGAVSVTYAQAIAGLGGATITGVAYEASTGDVYLSGNTGFNTDTLFHVANASSTATTVGAMANGDVGSYFSDIEFDAGGTLYAVSWFNRWFYTVSTVNAATSLLSTGPHRDVTAMAVSVPEPSTWVMAACGLTCGVSSLWRRRFSRSRSTFPSGIFGHAVRLTFSTRSCS